MAVALQTKKPVRGVKAVAERPDGDLERFADLDRGTHELAFIPRAPRRPREHEATRLLLTVAMQTTRRAAGLSAGGGMACST
jgi:hypothetical protein